MTRALVLLLPLAASFVHAQGSARTSAVTPELDRSAFADSTARLTLQRARVARLSQDSVLRAYDAKTIQRQSLWMAASISPKKLILRAEQATRVRWSAPNAVVLDPLGQRSAFPLGGTDLDLTSLTPIPYFPGKETLWFPLFDMARAKTDVSESDLRNPLARGAEAYYRYATGDSLRMSFPDGTSILIRELRITAREPDWHLFVGSFWFDAASGALVRAVYRLSTPFDLWEQAHEEVQKDIDSLRAIVRADTGAARAAARRALDERTPSLFERIAMKFTEGSLRPLAGNITAVTVEYALYEKRFWLPKLNVAEGDFQASMFRFPVRWEESYSYNDVNGVMPMPTPPTGHVTDTTTFSSQGSIVIGGGADLAHVSLADQQKQDSVRTVGYQKALAAWRDSATQRTARGDSAGAKTAAYMVDGNDRWLRLLSLKAEGCKKDSVYFAGMQPRMGGAVKAAVYLPCDENKLYTSKALPGSITDPGDALFDSAARQQLLDALDMSLQPPWSPQRPQLLTGMQFMRFNRLEGFSVGGQASSQLGLGFAADATLRYGFADHIPNANLGLIRSNGRVSYRLTGSSELRVANDDWGEPLSARASISNLLFGRDEGFYYRSGGASLTRMSATSPLGWRLFGERQRSAGSTPLSGLHPKQFGENIDADPLNAFGLGIQAAHRFGGMLTTTQLTTRARAEGAYVDRATGQGSSGYGRYLLDAAFTAPLPGPFALSFSGGAGTSSGTLPVQRAFFAGGSETVRGQSARLAGPGRVGDAFWLARSELQFGAPGIRLFGFYDAGWAGSRRALGQQGRPLTGAGAGISLLDGIIRLEWARGLSPDKGNKLSFYLTPR